MKNRKRIIPALLAVLLALLCCGCGADTPDNTVFAVTDVAGKVVGVMSGTAAKESVEVRDEAGEIKVYHNAVDLAEALKFGEVDCVIADSDTASAVRREYRKVKTLDEPYTDSGYRIAMPRGNAVLQEMVHSALEDCKNNGTVARIINGWMRENKSQYEPKELPEDSETVKVCVSSGTEPYTFKTAGGVYKGIEIDVIRAVCDRIGVKIEFVDADHENMVYMAESGKVSLAIGRITETDSTSVEYTDTYLTAEQYVLVRD